MSLLALRGGGGGGGGVGSSSPPPDYTCSGEEGGAGAGVTRAEEPLLPPRPTDSAEVENCSVHWTVTGEIPDPVLCFVLQGGPLAVVVRTSQSGLIPDTPGPPPEISGLIPDTADLQHPAPQSCLSHRTSKSGLLVDTAPNTDTKQVQDVLERMRK